MFKYTLPIRLNLKMYTLLSTGEVRVVLFPHKINAWISATEKADKKNIPK